MRQVLIIFLLQLFAVQAYSQDTIIPKGEIKRTERAILEEGYLEVGKCTVFQAAGNENLCTDNDAPESCASKYFYYVLPKPEISDVWVMGDNEIGMEIKSNMPDNIDIVGAIHKNLNRYANTSNIRPFEIVGYRIIYDNKVMAEVKTHSRINDIELIAVECDNPEQVVEYIRQRRKWITLELLHVVKHKRTIEFEVTAEDSIDTEYFRDLLRPVEGNQISAFQISLASRIISSKLISKSRDNGPVSDIARQSYEDMKDIIYKHVQNYITSVFEQAAMSDVKQHAIDLSHDDYATDYTTRVVYTAAYEDEKEWENLVHEEEQKRHEEGKVGEGSGAMGVLKLFKMAFQAKKGERYRDEWHRIFESGNKGKELIKNSVNYESDGTWYHPKSIKVYEIVSNDWGLKLDFSHISTSYEQSVVPHRIQLRYAQKKRQ